MVTLPSILQAPIQALVRPAQWLPCLQKLHSYREIWKIEGSPQDLCQAVINAVNKIKEQPDNKETFDFHKLDTETGFVRLFAFTRAEWLDVVELSFKEGWVEAYSFSSGVVPLIVPCACLCNITMFFAPFLDWGLNKARLEKLREAMSIPVQLAEELP